MRHPDMIRGTAHTHPDRLCVVEGTRQLTYAEVDDRADRVADGLIRSGLDAGARVALLAQNELEYLEIIVGCQRANLTLVPLNTRFTPFELNYVVQQCNPSLLICGPGMDELGATLDIATRWHLDAASTGLHYHEVLAASAPIARQACDPDALATILFTSGTTGQSKGAMISNRAQLARSMSLATELKMGPDSVFLQMLPMFHLAQQFSCAYALTGGTNVLMSPFSPATALAEIQTRGATDTLLVPTILKMLLDEPTFAATDTSSLKQVLYGGSAISADLLSRAIHGFDSSFFQMYGMTESGPATLLRPADHDEQRPSLLRSAGSPIVTFDLGISDGADGLNPPGEPGEILLTGPGIMDGYWGLGDETATSLRDGWLHTGDTGYVDERGRLFVTDRVKDMIVTGGENVSPVEVEHALITHPEVTDCAVIAVADPHFGECVHAVIVAATGLPLPPESLELHCRTTLAGYKVPRSWSFATELPRTATGKVRKNVLRSALRDSDEVLTPTKG